MNVNFFPLLMLLYVYYTVIHYYKTQTKLLKYIWESEKKRNLASWIVIFSACVFIAKCSPSSSANRRLHKQKAVYPFWFLHIICGLNFWRLFSTVKKFKFRKCNCIQYTQKTTHCLEMRTFCKIIARYHAWNSSIFFVELSQTFIISISRTKKK